MDDEQLRAIVRDVIARRLGAPAPPLPSRSFLLEPAAHASHGQFRVAAGADRGGPCLIEPSAECNHCGYCRSMGH